MEEKPFEVGGYVLAGGKAVRMGTDKALMELGGCPLIEHAVRKLRGLCAEVQILSSNRELELYAPLVPDLHPGCGPIGGMEAALLRSTYEWNVFLAVDMPFLPVEFLRGWMREWMEGAEDGARVRMFRANDRPQPGFCAVHRDVTPYLFDAIKRGEFKLMSVLERAGRLIAVRRGFAAEAGLRMTEAAGAEWRERLSEVQRAAEALWFANLNTPEDLAEAEEHVGALDG
jgi:molybdenum cofactor guanylyltransferase